MDNIRGIIGCPATGLTPGELLDTAPIAREFQRIFLGNKDFTNLPRKFNVTITGCLEHCTSGGDPGHLDDAGGGEGSHGGETPGFNLAVGGKQGSGGPTVAVPLDAFVRPGEAAEVCAAIALIFRDHGPRESRSKARLAFLLGEWGAERFRKELEARLVRALPRAGRDARGATHSDHIGVFASARRASTTSGSRRRWAASRPTSSTSWRGSASATGRGSCDSRRRRTCCCPTSPTRGSAT